MMSQPLKNKGKAILRINHGVDRKKSDYEKIETSLKRLDGITYVSVDEVTNVIKVEFNPRKVTLDEIHQSLQRFQKAEKS